MRVFTRLLSLVILGLAVACVPPTQEPSPTAVPIETAVASATASVVPTETLTATQRPTEPPSNPLRLWSADSPFNQPIPQGAVYTRETRVSTIRQNFEDYSVNLYRVSGEVPPEVRVVNRYSGRTVYWPIPTYAQPTTGSDRHLAVRVAGVSYEFWDARWRDNATWIRAGGMLDFPLDGLGISDPPNYRVVAAGFAITAGMVLYEDFLTPGSELSLADPIDHALTMSLPFDLVQPDTFVAPAVGGEELGRNPAGVPIGARFALPRSLNVDALGVDPLVRELCRALRDYGVFLNDTNGTPQYQGGFVGAIRIEPGLTLELTGVVNDSYLNTVAAQMAAVLEQYGLWRVTGVDY